MSETPVPSRSTPEHSKSSQGLREQGLTPYEIIFQSAPPDFFTNLEPHRRDTSGSFPLHYFFYGTLTKPENLKRILDLEEEPQMRKAQISGYALAKWGDYPALIIGEPGQIVSGYTYAVKSEEEMQKLIYYETKAYEVTHLWIEFTDGGTPPKAHGRGFIYAGDAQALLEQRFDRKLWARQMGDKLG